MTIRTPLKCLKLIFEHLPRHLISYPNFRSYFICLFYSQSPVTASPDLLGSSHLPRSRPPFHDRILEVLFDFILQQLDIRQRGDWVFDVIRLYRGTGCRYVPTKSWPPVGSLSHVEVGSANELFGLNIHPNLQNKELVEGKSTAAALLIPSHFSTLHSLVATWRIKCRWETFPHMYNNSDQKLPLYTIDWKYSVVERCGSILQCKHVSHIFTLRHSFISWEYFFSQLSFYLT